MNITSVQARSFAIAAFVLAASLIGWKLVQREPGSAPQTARNPMAAAGPVVAGGVASTGTGRSVAPGNASNTLLSRYNSGDNLRAFVDYALQHPEQGGHFYASHVLTQCRGITMGAEVLNTAQLPYSGQPDYAERAEAAARLNRQCAGFLQEELAVARDRDILSQGERLGDPLVRAARGYSLAARGFGDGASDSAARRAAMSQILATPDPLLFEDLGARMSMYVDSATGRKYFWFAGRPYALDSEVDFGGAIYLLPCGLGWTCDKTEFTTAVRCASGEGCDASRFDYLRRIYAGRPGAYEKVLALQSAMLDAVRNKDVSAFVR